MVTGTTTSRLIELKKYKETNLFINKYRSNGSLINNGVDYLNSVENSIIVYYIDGIKYVDILNDEIYENYISGQTIQIFTPQGVTINNFIDANYIKNPNKTNIINSIKLINDVFIDRQELSVMEDNYRLEFVDNMSDLLSYVGGNYFTIVNNN